MSVRSIIAGDGVGIYNNQRNLPAPLPPVVTNTSSAYVRPADWPALASISSTDQKFSGLIAITNDPGNYVALTCTLDGSTSIGFCIISNGAGSIAGTVFSPVGGSGASLASIFVNQIITGSTTLSNTYITSKSLARFTATYSGTTLTVSSVASGTLYVGMCLTYGGDSHFGEATYISAFGSGSGGTGTYTIVGTPSAGAITGGVYYTVNNSQFVNSFTATITSSYTVDWGDGTTSSITPSGSIAQKQYNYSTYSGSVLAEGYKAAVVNITNFYGGNLTGLSLQQKYVIGSPYPVLVNGVITKWLDVALGSPYLTTLGVGGSTTYLSWLQQFQLISCASSATTIATSLLASCYGLQSVPTLNLPSNYTTLSGLFNGCYSLKVSPTFPSSSVTVNCNQLFYNCYMLETVKSSNFSGIRINSAVSMFQQCFSLKNAPMLDLSNCINVNQMFRQCENLISVPWYNTANCTNFSQMFVSCYTIKWVPTYNTGLSTTCLQMFNQCFNLIVAPSLNLTNCTTTNTMFSQCYTLKTIPSYNMPNVTDATQMFNLCYGLTTVGNLTTSSSLLNCTSMFSGCYQLTTVPLFVTSGVTNMTTMFSSCSYLQSVPLFDTGNVTTMNGMFQNCYSLQNVPTFNTIKVTDMTSMFYGSGLATCPNFNTGNVLNMTTMFSTTFNLQDVLFTNTTKVTNMTGMFASSYNLNSISTWNSWDTSNVTTMNTMFQSCYNLQNLPTFNTIKVTDMTSFASTCQTVVNMPTYNLSNCITTTNIVSSSPSFNRIQASNLKVSTSLTGTNLNKTALEEVFANTLIGNATSQTITITSCPGADTAVAQTISSWSGTSNVMSMANTVGVAANQIVLGTTFSSSSTTVNIVVGQPIIGIPFAPDVGSIVGFTNVQTITNINTYQTYYVTYSSGTNMAISATPGGANISFTGTSSSLVAMRIPIFVKSVVANSSITCTAAPAASGSSASASFRYLNVGQALIKNWTITG